MEEVSTDRFAEISAKAKARMVGAFFLLTMLLGIVAEVFISGTLIVPGDAATTAKNILDRETLFRMGFTIYLVEMLCQVAMVVFLYDLLKPVNRSLARLSLLLEITGIVIKTFSRLFYIVPLLLLGAAPYWNVFSTEQSQAMALLSLKVNSEGAGIALVFFGLATLIEGYLVFNSTFLPRFLGVVGMVAGSGWLLFLYPPFAYRVLPFILLVGLLGALLKIFWLLVFGVNEERWTEKAGLSAKSIWR